jgi:hypothetical protein
VVYFIADVWSFIIASFYNAYFYVEFHGVVRPVLGKCTSKFWWRN